MKLEVLPPALFSFHKTKITDDILRSSLNISTSHIYQTELVLRYFRQRLHKVLTYLQSVKTRQV